MDISREGQIERTGIYYHINKLTEMGLIQEIQKEKRTIYLPADPKKVKQILQEKVQKLNESLPELEKIFSSTHSRSISEYYQGPKEIISLYEKLYQIAKGIKDESISYYIFGHSFDAYEALPDFFPNYIQKRSKLSIKTKIILPAREKPNKTILKKANNPLITAKYSLHVEERRYLDTKYDYPGTTLILDKYIATIDFKTYFGTLIENKNLAQTWKILFEFIWDNLPTKS